MDIKYRVVDDYDNSYGVFTKLQDAREHAQEVADDLLIDVFVEKVTTEILGCFKHGDKDVLALLQQVQQYEKALQEIAGLSDVSPLRESELMRDIAQKTLD